MRKFLKKIKVLQEVSNKNRTVKLGRGFNNAHRLNPYNPLSYITAFLCVIIGLFLFGVVGFWKETDTRNPFIWD